MACMREKGSILTKMLMVHGSAISYGEASTQKFAREETKIIDQDKKVIAAES